MALVTSNASVAAPLANRPASYSTIRIEPPRGWLELRLDEVWQYRELLYFFVWRDVKVRYKQTVIGVLWVVLQPLLTMGVFTLFFGRLAKLPSNGLPYPVFYFAALVPWAYFSTALQSCTSVVVDNQRVITKVYFPRLVLVYPSSLVPQRWRWLYGLNPMAGVIDGFRWALTGHGVAPGPLMLASASAVMVVLLGGLFFFQRMEGTVADRV
jgi:ABC-type polysaccharide/polyol phosphate export permease